MDQCRYFYICRLGIVSLSLCQHGSHENYVDDNSGDYYHCYCHRHHQRIRFEPVLTSKFVQTANLLIFI